jgi:hypothetical protein
MAVEDKSDNQTCGPHGPETGNRLLVTLLRLAEAHRQECLCYLETRLNQAAEKSETCPCSAASGARVKAGRGKPRPLQETRTTLAARLKVVP